MFICILKGFGSFLLVAVKSGQKWFGGSVISIMSREQLNCAELGGAYVEQDKKRCLPTISAVVT